MARRPPHKNNTLTPIRIPIRFFKRSIPHQFVINVLKEEFQQVKFKD